MKTNNHSTTRPARMDALAIAAAAALALSSLFVPVRAYGGGEQQRLVDEALVTFNAFADDPDMGWFRSMLRDAEGILIVPAMFEAGLVLGGSGGKGVLLARDEATGEWSGPAFYSLGSVSGGLQIGAQVSEVALLVMSKKGVEALYSSSVKLGGDMSVAMGPVGTGAEGSTSPLFDTAFVAFARSKGAYAGIKLKGAVIGVDDEYNAAYYGRNVRPTGILVSRWVQNPGADGLINAVAVEASRP